MHARQTRAKSCPAGRRHELRRESDRSGPLRRRLPGEPVSPRPGPVPPRRAASCPRSPTSPRCPAAASSPPTWCSTGTATTARPASSTPRRPSYSPSSASTSATGSSAASSWRCRSAGRAGCWGCSNRKLTRTGLLEYHYEKYLYGDTSLFELPETAAAAHPRHQPERGLPVLVQPRRPADGAPAAGRQRSASTASTSAWRPCRWPSPPRRPSPGSSRRWS